jgi:hypothetical protein
VKALDKKMKMEKMELYNYKLIILDDYFIYDIQIIFNLLFLLLLLHDYIYKLTIIIIKSILKFMQI